ncbi:MAG: Cytochrome c biogenesis protein CcsA [Elusimicrobia bacterium]|nr:Cytochrome c biogenesis protein CcsA [Elusimicrobiota bacterium]
MTDKNKEKKWKWVPAVILLTFMGLCLSSLRFESSSSQFNTSDFARLPVLHGGRLKPLDSVARTSLMILSGKQTLRHEGRRLPATLWLMEMLFRPAVADGMAVFQINDPDVLGLMKIEQTKNRFYSFQVLLPHLESIEAQAAQAEELKPEVRSRYQRAVVNLNNQMTLYQRIQNSLQVSGEDHLLESLQHFETVLIPMIEAHLKQPKMNPEEMRVLAEHLRRYQFVDRVANFYPIPSRIEQRGTDGWVSMGRGVMDRRLMATFHPAVLSYSAMADAARAQEAGVFNRSLARYQDWLEKSAPELRSKMNHELLFNNSQPFYLCLLMYATVFLLTFLSWLLWPQTLNRAAFWLLLFSLGVHTVGLVSRMMLQGRPPVTNLYSSAVFVGWMAVLLGAGLEWYFRKGIGSAVSSVIGFVTLIIAHHLAAQGDTLEMMRAVLDSNFWLATHVVAITVGYSSTFLSGALAILYILRERFDPRWNQSAALTLEKMVYGVVCFNVFFSFVGTVLGGIWADQSWGRFWGWDPKENGALMIVLWNAAILHARWGGFAKQRGIMALAILGNVVTALSWFGVNMLGIGLHSYGFMEKAFWWILVFSLSQFALVALAYWPKQGIVRKTKM